MVLKKLTLYFRFARPFTLLPPLLGILSGSICAFGSAHNPDPQRTLSLSLFFTVLLGGTCASLLNAASNILNQIYDRDIDRINKPKRFLVTGEISLKEAWRLSWILYLLAILPTWWVVPYPRITFLEKFHAPLWEHQAFFIYLLGLFFTFLYSNPTFGRTKRFGIWANITIAIPRGCLLKVAGWTFVASSLCWEPWLIGIIFMLFLIGASSTKDFSDMEGDRLGGCYTLPIRYGVKKAALIMAPFFILPWLLIPLGTHWKDPQNPQLTLLTGNPLLLNLLSVLLILWGIYTVWLILKDPEALARVENHPSWGHMYGMMMVAQIGFALAYIF